MKIAELASQVGVPTSTVRYYERIGLLDPPGRTAAGYRDYGRDDAARLLFVTRARRMGLSCDQIADLLPIWGGADCPAAHDRVSQLITEKQADIAARIAELTAFAEQLDVARGVLDGAPPPSSCRTDLSCCMPETSGSGPVPVELAPRQGATRRIG